ncbi:MAG: tRNA dihydrouridine(20/20a) synthase DusA, partial [Snowella sp.]
KIGEDWGYDEINLNVGCPSDRVQNGHFGACLMARPVQVGNCLKAMQQAVSIPVTVKHRIGIDDQDKYEDLKEFVQIVAEFGCQRFTVHARKAWLKGLSPKENRTIPPLRYEDVYRLKTDFPQLFIEINGGIRAIAEIQSHLQQVDAVMIGRVAYENPYFLATVDRDIYGEKIEPLTRAEIVRKMLPYIDEWTSKGLKLHAVSRHLLTLFNGQPGTKAWKRHISENAHVSNADSNIIKKALQKVSI